MDLGVSLDSAVSDCLSSIGLQMKYFANLLGGSRSHLC
jgi:hypothetical protein